MSTTICWAPLYSPSRALPHPLLGSADAGRTWRPVAIHGPRLDRLESFACAGIDFCLGAGVQNLGHGGFRNVAVSTTDGGRTWNTSLSDGTGYRLAVSYRMSCPAAGVCLAGGFGAGRTSRAGIAVTTDGGAHWRMGHVPRGIDLFWDISCPSARHCWAVGRTGEGPGAHGVIVATSDGGARWHLQTPPPNTLSMNGISCVDDRHCTSVGFHHSLSSVVVTTADGGAHWRPQAPPPGATFLSSLWCTSARRCLAPVTRHYLSHGAALLAATS